MDDNYNFAYIMLVECEKTGQNLEPMGQIHIKKREQEYKHCLSRFLQKRFYFGTVEGDFPAFKATYNREPPAKAIS